jgi:hypothetical protein
LQEGK